MYLVQGILQIQIYEGAFKVEGTTSRRGYGGNLKVLDNLSTN